MRRIILEDHGEINIKEGTYFPLNFSIQDLSRPDDTPASYSKDVVITGNKDVNRILSHAYDVNISMEVE